MRAGICGWLVILAVAGNAFADDATSTEALLAQLPNFDTSNPACPPFRIVARFPAFDLLLSHDSAKRRAIRVCGHEDGTPIFVGIDDEFAMYDPIAPAVVYCSGGTTDFQVVTTPGKISLNIGVKTNDQNSSRFVIDLREILDGKLTREDDEAEIRVMVLGKWGRCTTARFDAAAPHRVKSLDFERDDQGPYGGFVEFDTAPTFHPAEFRFPRLKAFQERLPVHDLCDAKLSFGDAALNLAELLRTPLIRAAIMNEEIRKELPFAVVKATDWEKTRQNDLRDAPLLRELFPPILPVPDAILSEEPRLGPSRK